MVMKKLKTFDCSDMPNNIREAFFKWFSSGDGANNGVYVNWYTQMWTEEAKAAGDWGMSVEQAKEFHKINNWLLKQGMKKNEDVLIRHAW